MMIMEKIKEKIELKKLKTKKKVKMHISTIKNYSELNSNNILGAYSLSTGNLNKTNKTPKKPVNLKLKKNDINDIRIKILKTLKENNLTKICFKNKKEKLKLKNENTKLDSTIKTSNEMAKKFYLRNREALKGIGKSNDLYSGFIKDPRKIINKILFDYKNIKRYDREVLLNSKNNYERNIEYIENQVKIKRANRIKESVLFYKLKNKQQKDSSKPSSPFYNQSESYSPIYPSSIKKSKLKEQSVPSMENIFESEDKLDEIANESIRKNNHFMIKKFKKNAIKFCKSISHINVMCRPYEPINEETSRINLRRNIYYNLPNLERLSKLKTIIHKGFDEEDFELNGKYIKDFSKEYDFMADKALSGYLPKYAKKTKFHNETILRYNNFHGKFFGFPV